jgi:hypothetical protein
MAISIFILSVKTDAKFRNTDTDALFKVLSFRSMYTSAFSFYRKQTVILIVNIVQYRNDRIKKSFCPTFLLNKKLNKHLCSVVRLMVALKYQQRQ